MRKDVAWPWNAWVAQRVRSPLPLDSDQLLGQVRSEGLLPREGAAYGPGIKGAQREAGVAGS